MNIHQWLTDSQTQELLTELKDEIKDLTEEVLSGNIILSPDPMREYFLNIGTIKGLKRVFDKIEDRRTELTEDNEDVE